MKKILMDIVLKLCIILGICLISFSIFYYFVIFLPFKENQRLRNEEMLLEQQRSEFLAKEDKEQRNRMMLDACLEDAYSLYIATWDSNCEISGINHKGDNCSLPSHIADKMNKYHEQLKDGCYKKYPQK